VGEVSAYIQPFVRVLAYKLADLSHAGLRRVHKTFHFLYYLTHKPNRMNRPGKNKVKALSQRTPILGIGVIRGVHTVPVSNTASPSFPYLLPRRPKELRENVASKHVPIPQNTLLRVLPYIPPPCLDCSLFLPILVIYLV
jgi:hypothetical protein